MTKSGFVLMGMAFSCCVAMAQSSGSPYEPDLRQILLEGKAEVENIKPFDDGIKSLLPPGAEFRLRVDNWDPPSRTVRLSFFAALNGSPLPSVQMPDSTTPAMIYQGRLRADSIYHIKDDLAIAFAGRLAVAQGGGAGPKPGDVLMLSISYPMEAFQAVGSGPITFGRSFLLVPGGISFYIPDAIGSITMAAPVQQSQASK